MVRGNTNGTAKAFSRGNTIAAEHVQEQQPAPDSGLDIGEDS
jgi:hypothetical protein